MPGTSLVAVSDTAHSLDPFDERRRIVSSWLLAGLALAGWAGFLMLAAILVYAGPARTATASGVSAADAGALPKILVGPVVVVEPGIPTAVPVQLGPARSIPRGAWIRLDGMPALASLSGGYTIGRGSWKVPLPALPALTVTAPTEGRIASQIRIALMSKEGATLTEVQTTLSVMSAALCGAQASAHSATPDDLRRLDKPRPR